MNHRILLIFYFIFLQEHVQKIGNISKEHKYKWMFDWFGRNEQIESQQIKHHYIFIAMQVEQEEVQIQKEEVSIIITDDIPQEKSSLLVKMLPAEGKKKLIVSDLDLNNPQDRALSLCLKMVEMRKRREQKQIKLIEQIRKSRVLDFQVGNVSRVIARDHFIARHQYLRQTQYRTAKPKQIRKSLATSLILQGEDKKKLLQREIEVLQKSKKLRHRYQIRKMVQEILDEAIDYSITMHERKKKFHHKNQIATIDPALQKEWERRAKGKKGSLSLSRVFDLKMMPSEESEHQTDNDEEDNENNSQNSQEQQQQDDPSEPSEPKDEEQQAQQSQQGENNEEENLSLDEQVVSDNHA